MNALDTTYQTQLETLTELNNQFEEFLNLDESQDVTYSTGTGPSLAKVIAAIRQIQFVQPVKSFKTYTAMVAATSILTTDDVIQVTTDPDTTKNGYYKMYSAGGSSYTFGKVNYASLYDLGNQLPNPWNFDSVSYSVAINPKSLYTASITKSSVSSYYTTLDGKIEFLSADNAIAYATDFRLDIFLAKGNNLTFFVNKINEKNYGVTGTFVAPVLTVAKTAEDSSPTEILLLSLTTPTDGTNKILGTMTITFKGIDKDIFVQVN
jgi:hypothetical protein